MAILNKGAKISINHDSAHDNWTLDFANKTYKFTTERDMMTAVDMIFEQYEDIYSLGLDRYIYSLVAEH